MLMQKLKTHVKTTIGTPTLDFKWKDEHNEKLLSFLDKNFESSSLLEIQKEIKAAIREHFEPIGCTMFKVSEKELKVKLIPYKQSQKIA